MIIDSIRTGLFPGTETLKIVRDDLFPAHMGGNKARKMVRIAQDIEQRGCNAVVTTGGIQSNHCRVVALACASRGWKCHLILHGDPEQFHKERGNALLMRMSGADIFFVESQQIGSAMEQSMADLAQEGYQPYYLQGGGHNPAGVRAYVQAVKELKNALPSGESFSHIFLASGTGSTQAGILAGCYEAGWNHTRVHGISVARTKKRGVEAILEALTMVDEAYSELAGRVDFVDDFRFGGYGKTAPSLRRFIEETARKTGIVLDETYSGKAFLAMKEILTRDQLKGNILFWHTGGVFNLMAQR